MNRTSLNTGLLVLVLTVVSLIPCHGAQLPTIDEFAKTMRQTDGFIPFYLDEAEGRLLLQIRHLDREFLYLPSLATGLGSARLLLDRGTIGTARIAVFQKAGKRILITLRNPGFRAMTDNPALTRSVSESFPESVIGSMPIVAADRTSYLVDASSFLFQDSLGITRRLERAEQGRYRLDKNRSRIHQPGTLGFARNTEVEVALTFTSDRPGPEVARHAPVGNSITLRVHHSLVKLPDDGYRPRRFDPRIGSFSVSFFDFAKSFDQDYVTRFIIRHRLEKAEHDRNPSPPREPIIYYMDRAIPEPYRSAFREGGQWWNQVFEKAGFVDAFQILDMPEDMHPLDARYNVIQWVHRTEAGSSIGPSFVDPRTGEIIKAAVRMDSHRSVVDFDIYAGLRPQLAEGESQSLQTQSVFQCALATAGSIEAGWLTQLDPGVDPEEFVMSRRRQHSAHEVGHTLGLAHNFIAASYGRASVMDYPAPLIQLSGDSLDLSDAYRDGPGEYDDIAIRYAYTEFSETEEEAGLQRIVQEAAQRGLLFITNPDERLSSSYPEATTWINGSNTLDELERTLAVRRYLMDHFNETAIDVDDPHYLLSRRFGKVYFHHRFALNGATKSLGGMRFSYSIRGNDSPPTSLVPAEEQNRALALLIESISPAQLEIRESILTLMAPRPFGYRIDELSVRSPAGPAFDQISAARTLSSLIFSGILQPERAARLIAFADRDPALPTLETVVSSLIDAAWNTSDSGRKYLRRVVQGALAHELIQLAAHRRSTPEVRAGAEWGLRRVLERMASQPTGTPAGEAHRASLSAEIERFLNRRSGTEQSRGALGPPPGTPIGERGY